MKPTIGWIVPVLKHQRHGTLLALAVFVGLPLLCAAACASWFPEPASKCKGPGCTDGFLVRAPAATTTLKAVLACAKERNAILVAYDGFVDDTAALRLARVCWPLISSLPSPGSKDAEAWGEWLIDNGLATRGRQDGQQAGDGGATP
jgi:hypothetical protein